MGTLKMTPKTNPFLQASLILLMVFSNSGFALDSAGHDHSKEFSSVVHPMDGPQQSADPHAGHDMMHNSMATSIESHPSHTDPTDDQHNHEGEDCVCDDLCCLSSVSLFDSAIDSKIPPANNQLVKPHQFYQSISLDLLLPPPTR